MLMYKITYKFMKMRLVVSEKLILHLNTQSSVRDMATLPQIHNLVTVPTALYIQPAQNSFSYDQKLTNSDEHLLHACEIVDALRSTTSNIKRDCNPDSIYVTLQMEDVAMHNLAPELIMHNLEEAPIYTVAKYARITTQANAKT